MSVAPRTAKTRAGKRYLENKAPKLRENTKKIMLLFGQNTTEMLKYFFRDMARVTGPHSTLLSRKKEIRPFEDQEPIEYLSQKQDASLFMFGSHNKKRPHNVVFGRTYDGQVRDMVELGLESLRPLEGFSNEGNASGSKPCIVFNGVAFEQDPVHVQLKSILIDMFRGDTVENISLGKSFGTSLWMTGLQGTGKKYSSRFHGTPIVFL
eukprot:m.235058 g.235058  ORF g.235058 m.235058 type:complete len:208 (+) comp19330_c2_seq2:174-797(+)